MLPKLSFGLFNACPISQMDGSLLWSYILDLLYIVGYMNFHKLPLVEILWGLMVCDGEISVIAQME
jgi:hypothetical protein